MTEQKPELTLAANAPFAADAMLSGTARSEMTALLYAERAVAEAPDDVVASVHAQLDGRPADAGPIPGYELLHDIGDELVRVANDSGDVRHVLAEVPPSQARALGGLIAGRALSELIERRRDYYTGDVDDSLHTIAVALTGRTLSADSSRRPEVATYQERDRATITAEAERMLDDRKHRFDTAAAIVQASTAQAAAVPLTEAAAGAAEFWGRQDRDTDDVYYYALIAYESEEGSVLAEPDGTFKSVEALQQEASPMARAIAEAAVAGPPHDPETAPLESYALCIRRAVAYVALVTAAQAASAAS